MARAIGHRKKQRKRLFGRCLLMAVVQNEGPCSFPFHRLAVKKVEYFETVSNALQADPSFILKDSKAFSEKQERS